MCGIANIVGVLDGTHIPIFHCPGRFRRLNKVYFKDVSDICKLTLACCVLLNLCILCDDEIDNFIDMSMAVNVNNYQNIFHNLPSAAAVAC
ncbi:hypothetical protein KUTeg_023400, partial [Tegillarca granosa]